MQATLGIIPELLKAAGGAVAVLGFPIALSTYARSVRTKRAEWLASLHEKFFESDRYTNVRRILDYEIEPEYSQLVTAVASGAYNPLADELYRYLNFFELLAGLRQLNQIRDAEVVGLFDYDLTLIRSHRFIVDALSAQGFERLNQMLQRSHSVARHSR
jgi:hypothetical protein